MDEPIVQTTTPLERNEVKVTRETYYPLPVSYVITSNPGPIEHHKSAHYLDPAVN